ncbi:hypothetical protein AVEN_218634-1 [Araneus ventricosus]|uniref:RNase H type-1 domain-containing protein n=1 Tax=Araneus ventricosus TaxID=182803 RepID=A0A4Y2SJH8_ARAVE|nr:hypothetical protein AVEN_218634-1 [Araneus ventricosus]
MEPSTADLGDNFGDLASNWQLWRRNVGSQKYWNFLDISVRGRAPDIQTLLLSHKHIHLRWLKAHVCYLGIECEDQLAQEAITEGDPFFLPKPLSYLKSAIRSAALSIWQDNWDNGETGRSTHDIVPRGSQTSQ